MNHSIVTKVTAPLVIATAVSALLLFFVVPDRQRQALEKAAEAELQGMAAALAVSVRQAVDYQDLSALENLNQLLVDNRQPLLAAVYLDTGSGPELMAEFPEGRITAEVNPAPEEFLKTRSSFDSALGNGYVELFLSGEEIDARMSELKLPLYFTLFVIGVMLLFVYRLITNGIVHPIIAAAAAADELGLGDLSRGRVPVDRSDEIGKLQLALRRLKTRLRVYRRRDDRFKKSLEEEVKRQTLDLRIALAAKDEFVATVSHELRTPLHSIVATLDLLHTSATLRDSGDKRYVTLARRGARALMQLIDELLDFQRLSQRELVIEQAPVHLQERLLETAEVGSVLFEESSIRFAYQINIPPELIVETDIQRLSQVLMNLVSNARKFTSRGEVEVVAGLANESENQVDLTLRVTDTGIGMSPEVVERLGEAFYQGGGGLTRQHAGTGLGLGIVKGILEAMGGELEIDSAPGAGSSFCFKLSLTKSKGAELINPFALPEPQGNSPAVLQGVSRVSASHRPEVLYVEDSETNRQVFVALLRRFDVSLTLAESAKEGFSLTRSQPFDLIVTDIQMPDYSGSDLLEWLRDDPGANVGVPIVACTANASSQFREEYLDSGFAGVLVKPVTLESLESFFAQHLDVELASANSTAVEAQ